MHVLVSIFNASAGRYSLLAWSNPEGWEVVAFVGGSFEWVKQTLTPFTTIPIPLCSLLLTV